MQNKVIIGSELAKDKKKFTDELASFNKSVSNKTYSLITSESLFGLGWPDGFRLFLENFESSALRSLVLSSAYRINKSCPLVLPIYFSTLMGKDISAPNRFDRVSSRQLFDELKRIDDGFLVENIGVLTEAIREAGSNGTVSIQCQQNADSQVIVEEGYKTLFKMHDFFLPYVSSMTIPDCSIIVVDGAIIEVSEIHHALQHSYDTKKNVLILARNMSEDVANTLLVNWQQKKTSVFPAILRDDIETINEVKDVCELIGVIPVSNQSGTLVSTIDFSTHPKSDVTYSFEKNELRIKVSQDRAKMCVILRDRLREQIEKESVEDVKVVLEKRMSRMSSRTVTLKTGFSSFEQGFIQDKASVFFTYFSKCAQQGIVNVGEDYPVRLLPGLEVLRAIRAGKSDRNVINSVKAILRLEE